MSSLRFAMLTLLAREPLSGYDIKQQMNNRMGPFWKVNSNQVYPELSAMEAEGLIELKEIEQNPNRPARKVYRICDLGLKAVKDWTTESVSLSLGRDEFLIKTYNSWMVEPEMMADRLEELKNLHEEKLAEYIKKMEELTVQLDPANSRDPIASSIAVVEFGIQYEQLYIQWCETFMGRLRNKRI